MSKRIHTVLIANRGEIAVRIAHACRDYGIRSAAVYTDVDLNALHVRTADAAFGLGDGSAQQYLNIDALLDAARRAGADAVHPGYGFLSESAAFAQAVINAGMVWIGPAPDVIARLGDKVQARHIARQVGAPLIAGTPTPVKDVEEVHAFVRTHGLPVIIKAAYGGGGRGMKVVEDAASLDALYASAVREATAAFGRGECFVEQYLQRPRHIEVQILGDTHGHVVVVGTRDCSVQRRHQKLIEEAPAPFLTDAQHQAVCQAAQAICTAAGYTSAGTVEFLLGENGTLSFLEVNTRLQVEHPVTEETTGVDLVLEQLRVADGLPLSLSETPVPQGHALEFRINAEDVGRGFLPTPGTISTFAAPAGPGVRLDTGVQTGCVVSSAFDSLMAKLVVTGATRAQALARARRALAAFHIEGVASVLSFHCSVLAHPDFNGETRLGVHTRWVETDFEHTITPAPRVLPPADLPLQRTVIELDGRRVILGLPPTLLHTLGTAIPGNPPADGTQAAPADAQQVLAPITGSLQAWHVTQGDVVEEGQQIAVMHAMKMEVAVTAHRAGVIQQLVPTGASYAADTALATIIASS